MISAAVEKAKLAERAGAPVPTKHRGETKPCPFQPCPGDIPKRWVACEFHWRLVPDNFRMHAVNLIGAEHSDRERWLYATVGALLAVAVLLEAPGVPMPWEVELARAGDEQAAVRAKAGHTGMPGCTCDFCGPLLRWALRVLGVSDESWAKAKAKYGR